MPPALLTDLSVLDIDQVLFDRKQIESVNPHRYEMQHLDGIVHFDPAEGVIVGFKEVTENEFWIRGHIPNRPIMPGVIMIESAAQLVSFAVKKLRNDHETFIGFSGIENTKFRGTVAPPAKLLMIGKLVEDRPRRFICDTQGFVDGQMIFESQIIGMPV
jgi:3-hydroxyacyl-[acyl-carrier-protein] dehydratase